MSRPSLPEQAAAIAVILSRLNRRLSVLDVDNPIFQLPVAQTRVCSILRDSPRTMSSLSRELGISLSAITQIADRLERAQLIERVAEEDDRRVKILRLTPRAVEYLRMRRERRVGRVEDVLKRLAPDPREEIITALQHLLDACPEVGPEETIETSAALTLG
ncbi:MAG TPA: MarR family transcriptional regulator [Armatimonadota bacterium]